MRAPRRGARGRPLVAVFLLAAAAGAGAADPDRLPPPAPRPDRGAVAAALRVIQNTCFGLYPPDLLRRMTGKEGPVPEEVRSDPRLQMKYLATEGIAGKGLFYPSLLDELLPAFEATVRPGASFLDLGSGDGRVVFMATLFGADATGIEYDRDIHRIAKSARRALRDIVGPGRARLKRGDFFAVDYAGTDVLFYFASGSYSERRLFDKIALEMHAGAVFLLAHGQWDSLPDLPLLAEYGVVRVFGPPAPAP